MLPYYTEELIEGYELNPKTEGYRTRYALLQRKMDPSCIILYEQKESSVNLQFHDITELGSLLERNRKIKDGTISAGMFDVIQMKPDYFQLYD